MFFELTETLKTDILFAMEDQTVTWVLDWKSQKLCNAVSITLEKYDNNKYLQLPEWTSTDGYNLLETFVDNLHSPLARADLRRTLAGGRGVFRNFKNVLKLYPDVEKRFSLYKDKCMKKRITEWYNELRESWGLEKIEVLDDENSFETAELLEDDFQFQEYNSSRDKNYIKDEVEKLAEELKNQFGTELGEAIFFTWQNMSSSTEYENKFGFVCYSHSGEFIASILFSFCPQNAKKTVILTDFFVVENYRGLGIGKEIFSRGLTLLREHGIQWVLLANQIASKPIKSLLLQFGFEEQGFAYIANLSKE